MDTASRMPACHRPVLGLGKSFICCFQRG
jgi:hypothetical protein